MAGTTVGATGPTDPTGQTPRMTGRELRAAILDKASDEVCSQRGFRKLDLPLNVDCAGRGRKSRLVKEGDRCNSTQATADDPDLFSHHDRLECVLTKKDRKTLQREGHVTNPVERWELVTNERLRRFNEASRRESKKGFEECRVAGQIVTIGGVEYLCVAG